MRDNDKKFTAAHDTVLWSEHIRIIRTSFEHPTPIPTLNVGWAPYDQLLILDEPHLRRVLKTPTTKHHRHSPATKGIGLHQRRLSRT